MINEAFAAYTGGGIWIFYGSLTDGTWFLLDNEGWMQILNETPEDFDVSLWEEWQKKHLIREPKGDERIALCNEVLDYLASCIDDVHGGGISKQEIEWYRWYFCRRVLKG